MCLGQEVCSIYQFSNPFQVCVSALEVSHTSQEAKLQTATIPRCDFVLCQITLKSLTHGQEQQAGAVLYVPGDGVAGTLLLPW